jgi:hypothetical protein
MNDFREQLMGIRKDLDPHLSPLPESSIPAQHKHDPYRVHDLKSSSQAIRRVKNPLPVPTECPHCQHSVGLVNNAKLYSGKEFGAWPYAYLCENDACGAYVGLHPNTTIPLGTLATASMRDARKKAKDAFNMMWKDNHPFTRTGAYQWLATQLGIQDVGDCHIGWFDVETCKCVIEVCNAYWEEFGTKATRQ